MFCGLTVVASITETTYLVSLSDSPKTSFSNPEPKVSNLYLIKPTANKVCGYISAATGLCGPSPRGYVFGHV